MRHREGQNLGSLGTLKKHKGLYKTVTHCCPGPFSASPSFWGVLWKLECAQGLACFNQLSNWYSWWRAMYSQETDVHRQNVKGFLPLLYVVFWSWKLICLRKCLMKAPAGCCSYLLCSWAGDGGVNTAHARTFILFIIPYKHIFLHSIYVGVGVGISEVAYSNSWRAYIGYM